MCFIRDITTQRSPTLIDICYFVSMQVKTKRKGYIPISVSSIQPATICKELIMITHFYPLVGKLQNNTTMGQNSQRM